MLEQNRYTYHLLKDFYLWYSYVVDADPADYGSPQALVDDLKFDPLDEWSFIAPADEFYRFVDDGEYVGLGFQTVLDAYEDRLFIALVWIDSPAGAAGLLRGDEILMINGQTISDIVAGDLWGTIFGENEIGVSVELLIRRNGELNTEILTLSKAVVSIDGTYYRDVIQTAYGKVGYLVYTDFFENTEGRLDTVFLEFEQNGINELVLDLRYNSGGRVSTAVHLGNLIRGLPQADEVFTKILYNDRYQHFNRTYLYEDPGIDIGLQRVVVITTQVTCSASELLINGLRPFMTVITVGDTTCGKPVGSNPQDFCDNVFALVNFLTLNANDAGHYYAGLVPTCEASDDVSKPLGDTSESALSVALGYLANGTCEPAAHFSAAGRKGRFWRDLPMRGLNREIGAF